MSMRLTDLEDLLVIDARGKAVGRVTRALFDPMEPLLVGFEVRMNPFGHFIERPRRYVAFNGVSVSSKKVRLSKGTPLERVRGRRSGVDWEQAVVWHGMPVKTTSGKAMGFVGDADIESDGRISRLELTRGVTSDLAVGIREVAGEHILGFSREAVRVVDVEDGVEFSGGVAAGAGKGAAVAKVTAERAAVGAARTAAAAARAAKSSKIGKRASASWKGFAHGIKEGMSEDDSSAGKR